MVLFYASTCHKAQGLTLPGVIVHCSKEFVWGLNYVADSRVRNDSTLRVLNFKPSQLLRPSKEALNVCNINRDCLEDLSCCRNQTLNDELFSVHEHLVDYGAQDGDAPESLSMASYADGFPPSYFDKDGEVPALHVDLATVFLTLEEQDENEQLSQPSDDFDITGILKKQLIPLQYLETDENFASSKNDVIELLLSEVMTVNVVIFMHILWFKIFQLLGDYLANHSDKVVIPRKRLRVNALHLH